jgi:hypothetical protein
MHAARNFPQFPFSIAMAQAALLPYCCSLYIPAVSTLASTRRPTWCPIEGQQSSAHRLGNLVVTAASKGGPHIRYERNVCNALNLVEPVHCIAIISTLEIYHSKKPIDCAMSKYISLRGPESYAWPCSAASSILGYSER